MSAGKKIVIFLIILVVIGAAGLGLYWLYIRKSPPSFSATDASVKPLSRDEKDTSQVALSDLIVSFDGSSHTVLVSGTATNKTNTPVSANILASLYKNVDGKQIPVTTYMITVKNVSAHQALTYNASESYPDFLDSSTLSVKTKVVGVFNQSAD